MCFSTEWIKTSSSPQRIQRKRLPFLECAVFIYIGWKPQQWSLPGIHTQRLMPALSLPVENKQLKKCQITTREKKTNRQNNIADLLEKLRRLFSKHDISVHFKPSNTLKQKLFHPKDKASKQKLNKLVYGAVQWGELWPLNRRYQTSTPQNMAQHRWAGQDSAVHLQ